LWRSKTIWISSSVRAGPGPPRPGVPFAEPPEVSAREPPPPPIDASESVARPTATPCIEPPPPLGPPPPTLRVSPAALMPPLPSGTAFSR